MERRKRLATTPGLTALTIVDIVLVFAALRFFARGDTGDTVPEVAVATQAPDSTETASGIRSASATQGNSAAALATSTTAISEPVAPPAIPLTRIITAVDGDTAWRGTTGTCSTSGAALAVTSDGGRTWQNTKTPYPVVTRVQPTDAPRAFVAGADPDCVMGVRSTTDTGTTWIGTGPGSLSETLTRDAKDPTRVRAPGGRTAAPCGTLVVIDLARSSTTGAQALCADGTLRTSADDGRTWPQSGQVNGALAIDSKIVGGNVTAFVVTTTQGCAGLRLKSVVNDVVIDLGCAEIASTPTPGTVALSVPNPDTGWLLVGAETWRSDDGLKTWARS